MDSPRSPLGRLLDEWKHRKLVRVAVAYLAVLFAALQGAELILSPLGADRAYRWAVIAGLAGFPVALVVAYLAVAREARAERSAGPGTRSRVANRLPGRRYGLTILGVVVAGLALFGYRSLVAHGPVMPDAKVIAVTPFSTAGGEDTELGEGMAHLLATNLDQVGEIRTVDPARVLRAWRDGTEGPRAEADAVELARRLGAGSVVVGSVVEAGDEVRLSARLHALSGREVARAQVTGAPADVLLLADSLSNRLLREIWRSRSPVPRLRISAITTGNLDAIRAYLEGERYYRQLRWDSAIAALQRAVEADSTFALAHRRLADAYGWFDVQSPMRSRHEAAAARTPERLPDRERAVARAYVLWHEERAYRAALDTLDSHLRRYPDDAEARDLRAEVLYHWAVEGPLDDPPPIGTEPPAMLSPFEEALELDPELTPAMIHPFEISAAIGDSVRFRRYATHLLEASLPPDVPVAPLVDSSIGVFFRGEGHAEVVRRLDEGPFLGRAPYTAIRLLINAGRDPNPALDAVLAEDSVGSMPDLASLLLAVGRLSDAESLLDRLGERAPEAMWRMRGSASLYGLAGPDFFPRVWPGGSVPWGPDIDQAWLAPLQAMLDITHGDTVAARRALRAARDAPDLPPMIDAIRQFQEGRLMVAGGQPASGIAAMEEALDAMEDAPPLQVAPPAAMHRVFLAIARLQYPPTRTEEIAEIQRLRQSMSGLAAPLRLHLARAFEAEGEVDAARREYAAVANLTVRAEGPLARLHREAVDALGRLSGDP